MNQGIVRGICISEKRGSKKKEVNEAVFVQDYGIREDAHAGKAEAIRVEAVIASLDGSELFRDSVEGAVKDAEALGIALANRLLDMGGRDILRSLGIEL